MNIGSAGDDTNRQAAGIGQIDRLFVARVTRRKTRRRTLPRNLSRSGIEGRGGADPKRGTTAIRVPGLGGWIKSAKMKPAPRFRLEDRGDQAEARTWLRKAAEPGNLAS